MLPAFNETANIFLQMYYQISHTGRGYAVSQAKAVVGENPFKEISRTEMIARTNIQAQAASFNFEKMNEKKEDVALYSMLRQELLIARNPNAIWTILKHIIKGWSPKWKNIIDQILPPLEKFQKDQQMLVFNAVAQYIEAKMQEAKTTGAQPEFNPKQLMALANDMLAMSVTPPDKDTQKKMDKEQANA